MKRLNHNVIILSVLLMVVASIARAGGVWSEEYWRYSVGFPGSAVELAVHPDATDGYDGAPGYYDEGPALMPGPGVPAVRIYRVNGPDWSGDTAFYVRDTHAPLGSSRPTNTWYDLYLYSLDSLSHGNRVNMSCHPGLSPLMPPWYRAYLYLDYVPAEAQWTGPMFWELDPHVDTWIEVPLVAVSDPRDGVRMHFTVVTPEPASILALGGGALGIAGLALRRRFRR